MATGDQLVAMISAHGSGDRERFRAVAMQAICGLRSDRDKERAKVALSAVTDDPDGVALRVLGQKDRGLVYTLPKIELGDLEMTDSLRSNIGAIARERQMFGVLLAHRIRPRSRILLHGPPGNGKTSIASAIASACHLNGFGLLLSQARNSFMGETAAKLHNAFQLVDSGGSLLFLDEFDAIAVNRTSADSSSGTEHNAIVSSLLQLLDRRPPGIVVAATNRLDIIDPAILRRFDSILEVTGPIGGASKRFAKSIFERHNWPIGDWAPPDVSSFAAIERDAVNHIRDAILGDEQCKS